jgi:glycosyltransferase involved in cell wall biosynthesis
MNIILGMIVRNEEEILHKTLPIMAEARFIERVALDTGSNDETPSLLTSHGFTVGRFEWKSNFSSARNELISVCRSWHPDSWLLMLDADECMYPGSVVVLNEVCERTVADLITLPRYNLADGGRLWERSSYPDKQPRLLRCVAPLEFRNAVHEVVHYVGHDQNVPGEGKDEFLKTTHIYHYGLCKSPESYWLRSQRYFQIASGEPESVKAPEWAKMSYDKFIEDLGKRHTLVPFLQAHPLKGKI